MTPQEAQQLLMSGQGTPEQLQMANQVYYGKGGVYQQAPSVQQAANPQPGSPFAPVQPPNPGGAQGALLASGVKDPRITPEGLFNYGGMQINPSMVRELDPYTGAQHFQYNTGGNAAQNANIANVPLQLNNQTLGAMILGQQPGGNGGGFQPTQYQGAPSPQQQLQSLMPMLYRYASMNQPR